MVDDVGAAIDLALASSPPFTGSFQAAPVVPVMFWNTSASFLAYFTPCT